MIRRIRKAVAAGLFLVGALFFILGAFVDSESYDRL
jgi:hypothetical protein